jgi:hypothetical protein
MNLRRRACRRSICVDQDHAESATALVREGVAVSLGTYEGVSVEALAEAASHLLNDSVAGKE